MSVHSNGQSVEFKLFLLGATRVEVLGSFTLWDRGPVPMHRLPSGWWRARLDVPSGEHEFVYRVDGREYVADYAADGVKLDHGRWLSVLRVEEQSQAAKHQNQ
jgi:1,4-alpha-glucan branching enzyme